MLTILLYCFLFCFVRYLDNWIRNSRQQGPVEPGILIVPCLAWHRAVVRAVLLLAGSLLASVRQWD